MINNKAEHHWGRDERLQLATVAPIFGLKKAQYVFQVTSSRGCWGVCGWNGPRAG